MKADRRSALVVAAVRGGLALLLVAALALPAAAAVVELLDLDQLVARSTLVLRGKVEGSASAWDESGRRIFTRTRIQVTELLKRGTPEQAEEGKTIEVTVPGGTVGEIGQLVPGAPRFTDGEDVLLFLETVQRTRWTPVALALGKFTVRTDTQGVLRAARDLTQLLYPRLGGGVVDPGTPGAPPEDVPLADVLKAIQRASR